MSEPTWIGKTIGGRYQIEELLGQGGMSAVYKAIDPNLRRAVAVKIIHPHLSGDQAFVRRFEEEAAAVAKLRHSNIIQVFDFNHEGNTYFIVFEFIPGESLQSYLKRLNETSRPMSYEEAVDTAATVGNALHFAHEQGLIHRDVKPANVMINVRQEPILMDFGIAKIVGGTQHTATGAVLGTARYMSPEQIKGQPIDARTDIYSLGVMLYEMLGGRPPFEADSAMTLMMMHIQDPAPDLGRLRPDLPLWLTAVIHKALEKERKNRFQTAAEFTQALRNAHLVAPKVAPAPIIAPQKEEQATQLETILEPEPIAVPTPKSPPPSGETAKSPLRKWLPIGGGLLAIVLVIIFAIMQFGGADDGNDPLPTEASQALVVDIAETETTETAVPLSTNSPSPTEQAEPTPPTIDEVAQTAAQPTIEPLPPTATPLPAVQINNITIEDGRYIADFDTIGFEPNAESTHIHFFFNTTSVENAGRPGSGPYEMVPNPSPFTNYVVSDRPDGATQLCALVANSNHTIQLESGNCVDLPAEPTPPKQTPEPTATTAPQPTATTAPAAPSVQITSVTEANGRYNINFQAFGYTPALPGMHVHFFFNTVAPENAGVPGSGPWKLYGGSSPFTEYTVADRPNGATQMCSLVANSDHSIQLGTGNCVNLP